MRIADFFCGGGGFSEGFRQAGFEIVFAVDKWEPAVKTYKGNKPGVNVIQDDVLYHTIPSNRVNMIVLLKLKQYQMLAFSGLKMNMKLLNSRGIHIICTSLI